MKVVVPTAVAAGVAAVVVTQIVDRDFMLLAASTALVCSYLLVLVSLWSLVWRRTSMLAPGLFGIAFFSIISVMYSIGAIILHRPSWYMDGWPFYIFIMSYGGLVGSVGTHLVSLGAVRGQRIGYIIALVLFIILSFAFAALVWMNSTGDVRRGLCGD